MLAPARRRMENSDEHCTACGGRFDCAGRGIHPVRKGCGARHGSEPGESDSSEYRQRRRRLRADPAVLPARPAISAIAAAGPIAGPILACQQFGWLPSLLWIGLGVVFIGAVHDFSTLVASVRHGARVDRRDRRASTSAARAWLAIMAFIWLALVYVIVAFTDITAATLRRRRPRSSQGSRRRASTRAARWRWRRMLYLLLAVVMGLVERYLKPPLWLLDRDLRAGDLRRWSGSARSSRRCCVLDARRPGRC